jgi:hypothetical protein
MIFWWFLFGGASGVYINPTYTVGILNPVVDTAGDFSTNDDPDSNDAVTEPSTSLNPTD